MMDVGDETHMLKPNNKGAENYGDGQVFFFTYFDTY